MEQLEPIIEHGLLPALRSIGHLFRRSRHVDIPEAEPMMVVVVLVPFVPPPMEIEPDTDIAA